MLPTTAFNGLISFGRDTQHCRGCEHPRPRYTGGYASAWSSLGKMRQAAKWGCEVCTILERGVEMYLRDVGEGSEEEEGKEDDEDEEKDMDVRLDFNLAASRRSLEVVFIGKGVTLSFFASELTPWLTTTLPDLPIGHPVPLTTSSPISLAWAQDQLAHCQTHHTACNTTSLSPLPSRVLDVLPPDNPDTIRLHVSASGESAPYLALSHCWGHRSFLRTLSGSLEEHRAGIQWERLPRSFQDAVAVTRQLGVRYLWIDSLCIVQDDVEDWRVEASRMAGVYQGAKAVLSAAKAEGASGGLFTEVTGEDAQVGEEGGKVYEIVYTPGEGGGSDGEGSAVAVAGGEGGGKEKKETQTIYFRRALSHPYRLLSPYHASASSLPIFTRGWVFQERFLSPRVLHFGRDELSFECLEATVCQCSPTPVPPSVSGDDASQEGNNLMPAWYSDMLDRTARPKRYYSPLRWKQIRAQQQAAGKTSDGGNTTDPLSVCWRRLVGDYTLLRLTHDGDIFPAVSGLARRMHEVLLEYPTLHNNNSNTSTVDPTTPEPNPVNAPDQPTRSTALDLSNPHYLAGLWSPTLLHGDLLWHVDLPPLGYRSNLPSPSPTTPAPGKTPRWGPAHISRPSKWRAPSWSWASVRAPVEFMNLQDGVEPACEVLDVRCQTVGGDLLGELEEGGSWLVVKGRVFRSGMRFRKWKGVTEKEEGEEDGGDGIEGRKREEVQPFEVAELEVLDGGYLKNLWTDDDCQGLVKADGSLGEVYLLVVGRKLPRKELLCLVLVKNDAGNEVDSTATYRRIGLLEVFGGPPRPVAWGWLHELLENGEDAVVRIV